MAAALAQSRENDNPKDGGQVALAGGIMTGSGQLCATYGVLHGGFQDTLVFARQASLQTQLGIQW